MIDWHPIETAPKDGTRILVLRAPMHDIVPEASIHECEWRNMKDGFGLPGEWSFPTEADGYEDVYRPTHWAEINTP